MKQLLENWRKYLTEVEFHDSPDEDKPGKKQIITFKEDEPYDIEGKTHGGVSHMIKHYLEFEPAKVSAGLKQALQKALEFDNFFLMNAETRQIIAQGDEAKKVANENAMLNTFDLINDKIKNNQALTDEEKQLESIISPLNAEYQKLVDSYMSGAVDIENVQDAAKIKQLLDAGKLVKFIGAYKGKPVQYFLNPSNTGLVAYKDGKVATLFRIDKKGGNLGKVARYFSRGVELKNPAFEKALATYSGAKAEDPQQQQKKKKKPQQQKKKASAGDIVRRLKQGGKSEEMIRQILAKAFPNLAPQAVDAMITNIKEIKVKL